MAILIALEYANVPSGDLAGANSEANMALFQAAEAFDPSRGEFHVFAARVIRNRLNTFYAKQLRMAQMFPKSLDDPVEPGSESLTLSKESAELCARDAKQDVINEVRKAETVSVLLAAMNLLSPRERILIAGLRNGQSYAEIAMGTGLSKQAVHKATKVALNKLKKGLERQGFTKVATDGHLG